MVCLLGLSIILYIDENETVFDHKQPIMHRIWACSVLSFSPQRRLAPHGGHFGQDAPQMPSLIGLGPPSKLFISVFIKNFKQIAK